jgi:hypothetical protein
VVCALAQGVRQPTFATAVKLADCLGIALDEFAVTVRTHSPEAGPKLT